MFNLSLVIVCFFQKKYARERALKMSEQNKRRKLLSLSERKNMELDMEEVRFHTLYFHHCVSLRLQDVCDQMHTFYTNCVSPAADFPILPPGLLPIVE